MNVLNGNNSKLFPQTRLHRRAYKFLFIDNRNPCGDLIHNAKNQQGNQGNPQTRVLKVLLAFSCFFLVLRFWCFKTGFYLNIFCSLEKFWVILCNNLKMRKFSTNLTRNVQQETLSCSKYSTPNIEIFWALSLLDPCVHNGEIEFGIFRLFLVAVSHTMSKL